MTKHRDFKQIKASALLFAAGIILGLALGLLIIPKPETVSIEIPLSAPAQTRTSAENLNPPTLGNPDAKVKIVEFTDLECPLCRDYYDMIFLPLIMNYINEGKIFYTFKDFPLEKYSHNVEAAYAAHCAGEQNRFFEMVDLIYENLNTWSASDDPTPLFKNFAQVLVADPAAFENCLTSEKYFNLVNAGIRDGNELKINATPTLVINGNIIEGLQTIEYYRQTIDAEIEKAQYTE